MAIFDVLKQAVLMEHDEPLSKAISRLASTGLPVVVMKKGKYLGLIDDRCIRQVKTNPEATKLGTIVVKAPIARREHSLMDLCKLFVSTKSKALPVLERGRIAGLLARADMLKEVASDSRLSKLHVADVMNVPPITIDSSRTVAKAKEIMRKTGVTHLIVTTNDKVSGVFSSFDAAIDTLLPKERLPFVLQSASVDAVPIQALMREANTIEKGASLNECALAMAGGDISAMPVVEGGMPIGMIVANDIFRQILKGEEARIEVSGLDAEDAEHRGDLIEEARTVLAKMKHISPVQYLTMHVKKYGNKYSLRVHVKGRKLIAVSSFGWSLHEAVKSALKEVRKIMQKGKPEGKGRARKYEE